MKTLAERLKFAMETATPKKVRGVDLARAVGVKPPSVSDWLSGKSKKMEGENLLKASKCLGVNPTWLANGQGEMRPAQSQRMGDMMQSQGTPVINENFLTQSPRSHALNALINKLDELEQQHLISEDEVSLLKHTLDVLAKSKSSSTNARQPQNPIFKDEE